MKNCYAGPVSKGNTACGSEPKYGDRDEHKPPVGLLVALFIVVGIVFAGFAFLMDAFAWNLVGSLFVAVGGILALIVRWTDIGDTDYCRARKIDRFSASLIAVGGLALAVGAGRTIYELALHSPPCEIEVNEQVTYLVECEIIKTPPQS